MKKRNKRKWLFIILLCCHCVVLGLRWIYWNLEWYYGNFYYIKSSLPAKDSSNYDPIKELYSEIMCDIYYCVLVTLIVIIYYLYSVFSKKSEE